MTEYAHPEVLVSTQWVADHLNDPTLRIVESNEDILLYDLGHIPGAVQIDWQKDLNDAVRRDYLTRPDFEALMAANGIANDTTVVFYGDKNNWWATYAFWVFQLFGHANAGSWTAAAPNVEAEGRRMTKEQPTFAATAYQAHPRARLQDSRASRSGAGPRAGRPAAGGCAQPRRVQRRTAAHANYPQEGALRGGHIPGAKNVPWARAANADDGTFKSAAELRAIYEEEQGLKPDDNVVAYCRIGERSSHTWFVLTYLLGYPSVRNYDGSWTEWGNLVGVPIEK
jgi:thiosulfate/3-mercaptopyruvate sulfurtransferase